MRQIFTLFVSILLIGIGIGLIISAGLPHPADYSGFEIDTLGYVAPEIGKQAPPFHLETLSGNSIDLVDLRGQLVIVNFWGTWCAPCRIEMPELQTLYEDYQAEGLRILAINLGENKQSVAQWVDELGLSYDILFDPMLITSQIYQIRGQPSTYVIAPDGKIELIYYGAISMAQLESAVKQYIHSS